MDPKIPTRKRTNRVGRGRGRARAQGGASGGMLAMLDSLDSLPKPVSSTSAIPSVSSVSSPTGSENEIKVAFDADTGGTKSSIDATTKHRVHSKQGKKGTSSRNESSVNPTDANPSANAAPRKHSRRQKNNGHEIENENRNQGNRYRDAESTNPASQSHEMKRRPLDNISNDVLRDANIGKNHATAAAMKDDATDRKQRNLNHGSESKPNRQLEANNDETEVVLVEDHNSQSHTDKTHAITGERNHSSNSTDNKDNKAASKNILAKKGLHPTPIPNEVGNVSKSMGSMSLSVKDCKAFTQKSQRNEKHNADLATKQNQKTNHGQSMHQIQAMGEENTNKERIGAENIVPSHHSPHRSSPSDPIPATNAQKHVVTTSTPDASFLSPTISPIVINSASPSAPLTSVKFTHCFHPNELSNNSNKSDIDLQPRQNQSHRHSQHSQQHQQVHQPLFLMSPISAISSASLSPTSSSSNNDLLSPIVPTDLRYDGDETNTDNHDESQHDKGGRSSRNSNCDEDIDQSNSLEESSSILVNEKDDSEDGSCSSIHCSSSCDGDESSSDTSLSLVEDYDEVDEDSQIENQDLFPFNDDNEDDIEDDEDVDLEDDDHATSDILSTSSASDQSNKEEETEDDEDYSMEEESEEEEVEFDSDDESEKQRARRRGRGSIGRVGRNTDRSGCRKTPCSDGGSAEDERTPKKTSVDGRDPNEKRVVASKSSSSSEKTFSSTNAKRLASKEDREGNSCEDSSLESNGESFDGDEIKDENYKSDVSNDMRGVPLSPFQKLFEGAESDSMYGDNALEQTNSTRGEHVGLENQAGKHEEEMECNDQCNDERRKNECSDEEIESSEGTSNRNHELISSSPEHNSSFDAHCDFDAGNIGGTIISSDTSGDDAVPVTTSSVPAMTPAFEKSNRQESLASKECRGEAQEYNLESEQANLSPRPKLESNENETSKNHAESKTNACDAICKANDITPIFKSSVPALKSQPLQVGASSASEDNRSETKDLANVAEHDRRNTQPIAEAKEAVISMAQKNDNQFLSDSYGGSSFRFSLEGMAIEMDMNCSTALFQNLSPVGKLSPSPTSASIQKSYTLDRPTTRSDVFPSVPARRSNRGLVQKGKWSLGPQIGAGSFGTVHQGMNAVTGGLMAVKVLRIPSADKRALVEDLQREIDLMKSLDHPNIVRYLGAEENHSKSTLYIFQEWIPGGSISDMLKKFGAFSIPVIRSYVVQVLRGLEYLHSHGIIHRDIKGGNILVDNEGSIKLADFGASKRVEAFGADPDQIMEELTMRGTPYFMAPEVFEEKYGPKADIWSVGGVIFHISTGNPPFKGMGFKNPLSLYFHLKNQDGPPQLPPLSTTLNDESDHRNYALLKVLISQCFQRDPSKRPSASSLLHDKFFQDDNPSSPLALTSPQYKRGSAPISPDLVPPIDELQLSVSPANRKPLDQIPENKSCNAPLSDSLSYSLTLPVASETGFGTNHHENNAIDTSEWPQWAKKGSKCNDLEGKENFETSPFSSENPFAKKAAKNPFSR